MDVCSERQQQFMATLTKRHGDKLDLSMVHYEGYDWPVTVRCHLHGIFEMKPRFLIKHERPFDKCRLERRENKLSLPSAHFGEEVGVNDVMNTHRLPTAVPYWGGE